MNIDEFFHQVELDTMQMCYEFDLSCAINNSYLNEAKEEKENNMSKVKIFFAKLKEKIIDAAKKVIQWFTEKLTIITAKIEDKKKSKISNKYSKDEIKTVLLTIVPKYLDSYKYYSPSYDKLNSMLMNAVRDHVTDSDLVSVKDIMNEYDVSKEWKKELIPILVSMIDSNNTPDGLKKDINDTKKWRDETIDSMNKLLKDNTYSSTSDYHKSCAIVMNIYMAGLKMRLANSKARIDLINLAEKSLNQIKKELKIDEEEDLSESDTLSADDIKEWIRKNNPGGEDIKARIIYPHAVKDDDINTNGILTMLHINKQSENIIVVIYDEDKLIKTKKISFKNIDSNFQALMYERNGSIKAIN